MVNPFLEHLDGWLPHVLREKAVASVREDRLAFIGATDFALMVTNYILECLACAPESCDSTCHLDHVDDKSVIAATGFSEEMLAAGFAGAAADLAEWQGEHAVAFLVGHDVPADDARKFVTAIDVVAERLGQRGHALLQRVDGVRAPAVVAPAPR